MDNVGTLLAAVLGGYLPGIVVGYLNNIINMQGNPGNAYYVVLSTMIAASGTYFDKKGYFKSFGKALLTIPVFALIGGALGSILTYLLYGYGMGEGISAPFARRLLENGTMNVFWAQMTSDIVIDLIDKAITVILIYLIIKLIPDRLKPGLWLTGWRQAPLSDETLIDAKKNGTRSLSLRAKMITIISFIMVCVAVVTKIISYLLYQSFAMKQYTYSCRSAAADIKVEDIKITTPNYMTKVFSLFIGFYIFILTLCIWLIDFHLIYPIAAMTVSARKFAYDSEEALEISVDRLQNLGISTGDEIENLYESLSKTIAETVGYLEDVEAKGEVIAHMQNGLIYVLADMVESRDKNTGDHVRKTAAYVCLIMQKMREKGLYPDILTDEYIADVANSAPLHDVGKIMVSDVILNKPGKLTDEEFAIMKSHTTAGSKIIASAIALVADSGYLMEAKNLATYHHERWDGSGYPSGKAGEDIPLSARIMAVADVFDALVSKRSYKDPFPFDKAMDIIREGAGTQFDPQIAQIFLEAADEVKEITEAQESMLGQGIRNFSGDDAVS